MRIAMPSAPVNSKLTNPQLTGGIATAPITTQRRYIAVRPPSMTSSLPVINDASSDARNSTP